MQPTYGDNLSESLEQYIQAADLARFALPSEEWTIQGSSSALAYATHGIFRYFGKFPPPVPERFIREFHHDSGGPIVDLTIGSGTTAVEAILAGYDCVGVDANPLACLVSRVKTTPIPDVNGAEWSSRFLQYAGSHPSVSPKYRPSDRYLSHWFHDETIELLAMVRQYTVEELAGEPLAVQEAHSVALASIVRAVSRASNGLARMFLDPAIKPADVPSVYAKKLDAVWAALQSLNGLKANVRILNRDSRDSVVGTEATDLVIAHPPYFNVYRYSSIYKFEMLWLGMDYKATRQREMRDGFKMGKPELLPAYVNDLALVAKQCERQLSLGGHLILMMGDTRIHEQRVNTTAAFLDYLAEVSPGLRPTRIIVRKPKYTEASYAAGQRRTKEDIGIKLWDHIVVLVKS